MALAKEMPISQIGDIVGEQDTRIWRIIRHHVAIAYAKKELNTVRRIGCDETSSRKGHNYVTVFADMDGGNVFYRRQGLEYG